jgi:hypothetical protein
MASTAGVSAEGPPYTAATIPQTIPDGACAKSNGGLAASRASMSGSIASARAITNSFRALVENPGGEPVETDRGCVERGVKKE